LQRQIAHATCAYGFHCQFKDSSKVVPTQQCECGNRFHTQCLSLSFEDAETQVDSHVNMDQCNLHSCSLQHAGQNADQDSPAKHTRGKQRALNAENKNIRGKSVTRGSGQYLHMQECLVYAAVEFSQQAFEGASMFRYGNKTQAFTKISRHLGAGQHKDLFKHEDGEFSINQMKHMLDDAICKFEDSGKKTATNDGRCQSGRNDGDLTSYEQACEMLCAWQAEVSHDSNLRKDAKSNMEAASVVASSLKQKNRPSPACQSRKWRQFNLHFRWELSPRTR
jgi:hypothetical protein